MRPRAEVLLRTVAVPLDQRPAVEQAVSAVWTPARRRRLEEDYQAWREEQPAEDEEDYEDGGVRRGVSCEHASTFGGARA